MGSPFRHFFCPILRTDEPGELCKGHVIPEAFGTSNAWVPQRTDVDNFFGTVAEADFIAAVEDRDKTAFEKWLNPKLNKRHRPRLKAKGVELAPLLHSGAEARPRPDARENDWGDRGDALQRRYQEVHRTS